VIAAASGAFISCRTRVNVSVNSSPWSERVLRELEQKRGEFKRHYEAGNMLQTIDEAFILDMDLE